MFANILVPVDLNDDGFADKAVQYAAQLLATDGVITLLKVVPGFQMPLVGSFFPKDAFAAYLKEASQALDAFGRAQLGERVRWQAEVIEGHEVPQILAKADALGADCIVMASHKHTPLNPMMVGSITQKVLARTPLPVLVVKP